MDYTPYIQRVIKEREEMAKELRAKYKRAWEVAKNAAEILKNEYCAKEVILFGSLLHEELFHSKSDIDLSVSGIPPQKFFQAMYKVAFLDEEIEVELVDKEDCKGYILEAIEKEGIWL